ncbi:lysosome membrane protein 2-like isoform X1 [Pieris napi]|uniref:lysosome membrane protein 2-like isoform X1 n=2 Tax=Pieris napi TaxID=78633 RepID=UPI001FB8CAD5|nr:lysosome membrane protein 2-like isoform X1 [Pieris napi]XP_047505056.1 lysosome membrane protein 2-like isoform X1 [Pieris napi]XP_047505057.1 lysosome membrane protein 2-like isoform X1 [Pieris napi]
MKQSKKKIRQLSRKNFWKIIVYSVVGLLFMVLASLSCIWDSAHILAIHMVRLSKGSIMYNIVTQKDYPCAYYDIYLFNITNGDAFLSGREKKLKVEEVGPFRYQEFRTNTNIDLDVEKGILKYTPKIDIRFIPEFSIADPRDVELQMPDMVMLAAASRASVHAVFVQYFYNIAVKTLKRRPIHTTTVDNVLWGTHNDAIMQVANTFLPGEFDFNTFGILHKIQNSGDKNFVINATDEEKFKIISFNGEKGLPVLGYGTHKQSRCNTFKDAYEGISYPIDVTKDTPLRLYHNSLCRLVDLEYNGTRSMDYGPEAFVYKIRRDAFSNTTETECVCHLPKCINGVTDLAPCFYGAPSGLSNAHFLYSDMKLSERLEGMNPDEEKHGSEFLIDPKLGVPLATKFTVQGNLIMGDVSFNSDVKVFSNMVVPLLYLKIVQPEMPEYFKSLFWVVYVLGPYIRYASIIILYSTSFLLLFSAFKLYYNSVVTTIQFPAQELLIAENNEKCH